MNVNPPESLLPCPFCGAAVAVDVSFPKGEDAFYSISCFCDRTAVQSWQGGRHLPDVVKRWNTRLPVAASPDIYRCRTCKALWRLFSGYWSLWPGDSCGKCCDNEAMTDAVVELIASMSPGQPKPTPPAATIPGDGLAYADAAERFAHELDEAWHGPGDVPSTASLRMDFRALVANMLRRAPRPSPAPREAAPPLPALTCELCGRTDLALWLLPRGKACITCYGAHHRDVEHARIVARIQEMGRNYDAYNDVASVIEAEGPGGKTP